MIPFFRTAPSIGGKNDGTRGNILIYLIGAIFLMALLVVILRGNFQPGTGLDPERYALLAGQARAFGTQVELGVATVLREHSESDLRFANPASTLYGTVGVTPDRQVFDRAGGDIVYQNPPIGAGNSSIWHFYANTHVYNLGSNDAGLRQAEIMLVLPDVSEGFCRAINASVGQTIDLGTNADPSLNGCVQSGLYFNGTFTDGAGANTLDETRFSALPPKEACIRCQDDGLLHYYRVLKVR